MFHRSLRRILTAVLLIALLLPCAAFAEEPSTGNLIHFIPTTISVAEDSATVYGYFINLNEDKVVSNFYDYEMSVYRKGDLLLKGSFGEINEFSIEPMGMVYQSFTFNGEHGLNVGEYVCLDYDYCVIDCRFSSRSV